MYGFDNAWVCETISTTDALDRMKKLTSNQSNLPVNVAVKFIDEFHTDANLMISTPMSLMLLNANIYSFNDTLVAGIASSK